MNKLPYKTEIITDTLYTTIIKVIIKGNIDSPVLLADASNLKGVTIESAIREFGGGMPLLPDIECVKPKHYQNSNEIKFNLVTFSVPGYQQVKNDFLYNDSLNNKSEYLQAPILKNNTSYDYLSYASISSDNENDLLNLLNNNTSKTKQGYWEKEFGNQYNYYISGIKTNCVYFPIKYDNKYINLDSILNSVSINNINGIWKSNNQIDYFFYPKSSNQTKLTFLHKYNWFDIYNQINIPDHIIKPSGQYQFNLMKKMSYINLSGLNPNDIENILHDNRWMLIENKHPLKIYQHKQHYINLINNNNGVITITGLYSVIKEFGQDIISNYGINILKKGLYYQSLDTFYYYYLHEKHVILGNLAFINNIKQYLNYLNCTVINQETFQTNNLLIEGDITKIKQSLTELDLDIKKNNTFLYKDTIINIKEFPNGLSIIGNDKIILLLSDKLKKYPISLNNESIYQLKCFSDNQQYCLIGERHILDNFKNTYPTIINSIDDKILYLLSVNSEISSLINNLTYWKPKEIITPAIKKTVLTYYNDPTLSVEVLGGDKMTTFWGDNNSITHLTDTIKKMKYKYKRNFKTDLTALIYQYPENLLLKSQNLYNYQILTKTEVIENLNLSINNPNDCLTCVLPHFKNLTIYIDIKNFIKVLTSYDCGSGFLGFRQVNDNMFRLYRLEDGGIQRITPYFILLNSNSSLKYTDSIDIKAENHIINSFIIPLLNIYKWSYEIQQQQKKKSITPENQTFYNFSLGKVRGLTGNIKKLPNCNAKPKLAITNINWSLNTPDNNNYVDILWETGGGDVLSLTGETAYIFSNSGSYGLGGTGGGGRGVNATFSDGGGQPAIPNNAFPNPTGNVLFRTNGEVTGTFTIRFYKYSGYYNYINFFSNSVNNLQSAIQSQQLIYRDWIGAYRARVEEAAFIPLLLEAEQKNRSRLRPSPMSNALIVNNLVSTIMFSLPMTNKNYLFIEREIKSLLDTYLNFKNPASSIGLLNREIDKPNDKIKYSFQYNIQLSKIPFGNFANSQQNGQQVISIKKMMNNLNNVYSPLIIKYDLLKNIFDFSITSKLTAYVYNQNNTSYLKNDSNDIRILQHMETELLYQLIYSDINLRNTLRPSNNLGSMATPNQNPIGGINAANVSRWLDTHVKRLLIGSEGYTPLNAPTEENPSWTDINGKPIYGFLVNAFATSQTLPMDKPPDVVYPGNTSSNLTYQPSNPIQFGNSRIRTSNRHNSLNILNNGY